jgi:hypothetical protein
MSQAEYLQRKFTLLKPLEKIKEVTVKPLNVESIAGVEPKGEQFTQEDKEALVMASTGLNQDELESLSNPDWLSIYNASYDFYYKTGYQLAEVEQDDAAKKVKLFFSGEREISFDLPTLKLSKMAGKISDDAKRVCFVIANLTELEEDEVMALPSPDYRSLVIAASNFLTKPAAYFQ